MTNDAITIILPVFGRSELLKPALSSVVAQTCAHWQLLIADDGSDVVTRELIDRWTQEQNDPRIHWIRRPKNLGLFANLNQAIEEAETEWILLLCSDDLVLPSAVEKIKALRIRWPEAGLILSTFESINIDGSLRSADSALHHDQVSRETRLMKPEVFVPSLLRLGSLNGNLTGMAFSRGLWSKAGPFRSDWRHASDWEWLIRVSEKGPLVLNREPIAQVRTHARQLSNTNRRSGHELHEVAAVVELLSKHPLLINQPKRRRWAADVMQHQLWNVLKRQINQDPKRLVSELKSVHSAAGLRATGLALLRSAPKRLRRWLATGGSDGTSHAG